MRAKQAHDVKSAWYAANADQKVDQRVRPVVLDHERILAKRDLECERRLPDSTVDIQLTHAERSIKSITDLIKSIIFHLRFALA